MAKYHVGDRFEVEITNVDDTGMGTVYYLNDIMVIEQQLNILEQIEKTSLSNENVCVNETPKAHTPEDLKNRIFALSKLLAETIEAYEKVNYTVNAATDNIDRALRDNSL